MITFFLITLSLVGSFKFGMAYQDDIQQRVLMEAVKLENERIIKQNLPNLEEIISSQNYKEKAK